MEFPHTPAHSSLAIIASFLPPELPWPWWLVPQPPAPRAKAGTLSSELPPGRLGSPAPGMSKD